MWVFFVEKKRKENRFEFSRVKKLDKQGSGMELGMLLYGMEAWQSSKGKRSHPTAPTTQLPSRISDCQAKSILLHRKCYPFFLLDITDPMNGWNKRFVPGFWP